MGLVEPVIKAVFCEEREAYRPIEDCRNCPANEGYSFAHHNKSEIFGPVCSKSTKGFSPEVMHYHRKHSWYGQDETWNG